MILVLFNSIHLLYLKVSIVSICGWGKWSWEGTNWLIKISELINGIAWVGIQAYLVPIYMNPPQFLSILYSPYPMHWQVLLILPLWIKSQVHVFLPISILVLTTIISYLDYGSNLITDLPVLTLAPYSTSYSLLIPRIFKTHTHPETQIFPCYLLLKAFQWFPTEITIKYKAYVNWPQPLSLTSCHVILLLHRILQLHGPPACFSNLSAVFLSQGICTCCALCLQSSSSRKLHGWILLII